MPCQSGRCWCSIRTPWRLRRTRSTLRMMYERFGVRQSGNASDPNAGTGGRPISGLCCSHRMYSHQCVPPRGGGRARDGDHPLFNGAVLNGSFRCGICPGRAGDGGALRVSRLRRGGTASGGPCGGVVGSGVSRVGCGAFGAAGDGAWTVWVFVGVGDGVGTGLPDWADGGAGALFEKTGGSFGGRAAGVFFELWESGEGGVCGGGWLVVECKREGLGVSRDVFARAGDASVFLIRVQTAEELTEQWVVLDKIQFNCMLFANMPRDPMKRGFHERRAV
mmetsp:Transcript_19116/g.47971  ORF Transcript_19116/g.47971 Transcript_19116/m.47971 type:complete len:278 (+) Transcript_19116:126-959(+)